MSQALTDFRNAVSAMLAQFERLRAEVDPTLVYNIPSDIRAIQTIVAGHFDIPIPRLLSRARDDDTATARQIAMTISREITRHSLPAIGEAFSRDHTTVVHGIRAIKERCECDELFRAECERVREEVRASINQPKSKRPLS